VDWEWEPVRALALADWEWESPVRVLALALHKLQK
jgi:hypothetical protein